jgi:hypothetical protein
MIMRYDCLYYNLICYVLSSILCLGILAFLFFAKYNYQDPALKSPLDVKASDPIIDEYLAKYADVIGDDMTAYKGHLLRVESYAYHFLGQGASVDTETRRAVSAALAYHDIALWTDLTLAYLEPSRDRAARDLKASFNAEQLELIENIIYWHHKITPFEGPHADIVNAVRKADWVDATMGTVHFGMPTHCISKAVQSIPYAGFHQVLMGYGSKLYGNNFIRIVSEISSIYKY